MPSCAEGGVLGILPGLIGCIQATEAVKLILGQGDAADRPAAAVRRPANELPRVQGAPQPEVPDVRRQPDDHAADRLRAVLRHPRPGGAGRRRPAGGEITVEELKQRLDRGEKVFILDVRNPEEYQICRIPGSTLMPLPALPQRFGELDQDREMVVHCKSGMRSAEGDRSSCGSRASRS